MVTRAVSLALAASALAGAVWLYTCSLWVWGPVLYFPFVGAPAIAGMMALRAALVRKLGGGPDPTARALEVIALGAMLFPGAGFFIVMCVGDMGDRGHCGLLDARAAATVLGASSPFWLAGVVVALSALSIRRSSLAHLRPYQAVATVLTLLVAPPLIVLAFVATCWESNCGGASVVVLLPAAIAAAFTLAAWTSGRSFATGAPLRRVAAAALAAGAVLSPVLSYRAPLAHSCESFWTTATWGLLAEVGWAACPCLAAVLYFARDPLVPAAT